MSREVATVEQKANPLAGAAQGVLRDAPDPPLEEQAGRGALPGRRAARILHVAIGQEAVAVGVCGALEEGDAHRVDPPRAMATLAKGTHPNGFHGGVSTARSRAAPTVTAARCTSTTSSAGTSAPTPSSAAACPPSPAPASPSRCAASRGSPSPSSATAPRTSAPSRGARPRPALADAVHLRLREQSPRGVDAGRAAAPDQISRERAKAFGMTAMTVDGQDVEAAYAIARARPRGVQGVLSSSSPRRTA